VIEWGQHRALAGLLDTGEEPTKAPIAERARHGCCRREIFLVLAAVADALLARAAPSRRHVKGPR
jgi:hypothetical protein